MTRCSREGAGLGPSAQRPAPRRGGPATAPARATSGVGRGLPASGGASASGRGFRCRGGASGVGGGSSPEAAAAERVGRAGDGCEPEPERAGTAGGLRAGGHREVPDRLVGAEAGRGRAGPGEPGPRITCVSHTCAAPRDMLSPPLSPLAPPRASPQPLPTPPAAGLQAWLRFVASPGSPFRLGSLSRS